jgi:hypothetical protein
VDSAFGARRFSRLKGALFETLPGMVSQRFTARAQAILYPVPPTAVDANHGLDGFPFPIHPAMADNHGALLNAITDSFLRILS